MKTYYTVEGLLYTLTQLQIKERNKLFPERERDSDEVMLQESLQWIANHGKFIAPVYFS